MLMLFLWFRGGLHPEENFCGGGRAILSLGKESVELLPDK
jgi:hypothetical protein